MKLNYYYFNTRNSLVFLDAAKGQFPLAKKASEIRNISDRNFWACAYVDFSSSRDFCQKIFFSARDKKS